MRSSQWKVAVATSIWRLASASAILAWLCNGSPWDLESYELCRHERLRDIPNEASGVTYSQVTNSLWVITRRPQAVLEYSLKGKKLRQVSHRGLRDPEGITWMYGYTFAVAQEGGSTAAIIIMDIVPWERSVQVRRKLVLRDVRCRNNNCFEGVTYDVYKNVFYAVQEMDPMKVWMVTPSGRATELMKGQTKFPGMRDLAGIYFEPLQNRLFVLSQTEQKVAELSWDGDIQQIIPVNDNLVEGLSFTPDGELMFNVGEPNDLWVYSSTGKCDWEPKEAPPKVIIERKRIKKDTGSGEVPEGGFCSFQKCQGAPQGSTWCNMEMENCVRGCGGTWCWRDSIGKALERGDLAPLPPSPPSPSPPPQAPPIPLAERTGFCTYGDCSKGRQGDIWCSSSRHACSVGCQGTYCWDDTLTPREGFCTYRSCQEGPGGDPWCGSSPTACTIACKGMFCWKDDLDGPLTAKDFPGRTIPPPPKAPQPPPPTQTAQPVQQRSPLPAPSQSAEPSPSPPPPLAPDPPVAEQTTPQQDTLPGMLPDEEIPDPQPTSANTLPDEEIPDPQPTSANTLPDAEIPDPQPTSANMLPDNGIPDPPQTSSSPNAPVTRTPPDESPQTTTPSASPGSVSTQTPPPPPSDSERGEIKIEMADDTFSDGYSALITIGLHGIPEIMLTPYRQLILRESVAEIAYGQHSGFLEVVFNSSAVDERNAVFSGLLSFPEQESESGLIQDLIDEMGNRRRLHHLPTSRRNLAQEASVFKNQESMDGMLPLTLHLLGETMKHAQLLANRTRDAVSNGDLEQALFDGGFNHPLHGIEMISMHIEGNEVAPQYYPAKQFKESTHVLPDAAFSYDYQEIDVTVMDEQAFQNYLSGMGQDLSTVLIIGLGACGVFLMLVAAAITTYVCKRARAPPAPSSDLPMPASSDTRKSFSFQPLGIATSDVQMSILPTDSPRVAEGPVAGHHRRMPSDVIIGAGLLSHQDAYTPTGTPGHSRPGSYLPEGILMEHVLAAAAAEATAVRGLEEGSSASYSSLQSIGALVPSSSKSNLLAEAIDEQGADNEHKP